MKSIAGVKHDARLIVAPYLGAWIEINFSSKSKRKGLVAPYLGAWIEIVNNFLLNSSSYVAPYLGAWIEIMLGRTTSLRLSRRSLLGGVD